MHEVLVGIILFLLMSYGVQLLLKAQYKVIVEVEKVVEELSLREDQLNEY
ncbi:hypothetical protein [Ignatzschineria cameli]|nr:hypothetical protein [Ignatzschineria cameli]